MTELQTFDFETNAVRVMMRDAAPWFVAADVCRVLGIVNPSDAIKSLDEDERNTLGLSEGIRGNPNVNVISESGLYTLVLRSRDAVTPGTVAHRFRKWVTADVLPSLRRTGTYSAPVADDDLPTAADGRLWGQPVAKINAAARMIGVARLIYGPEAARALWERERGLPSLKALSVVAIEEDPASDPVGAFRHLMKSGAGNGQTIGALLDLALRDKVAGRKLAEFGIVVKLGGQSGHVCFANRHKFLASVFAATKWANDWRLAFARLPGAKPSKNAVSFGDEQQRAVTIPIPEVLGLRNPVH